MSDHDKLYPTWITALLLIISIGVACTGNWLAVIALILCQWMSMVSDRHRRRAVESQSMTTHIILESINELERGNALTVDLINEIERLRKMEQERGNHARIYLN